MSHGTAGKKPNYLYLVLHSLQIKIRQEVASKWQIKVVKLYCRHNLVGIRAWC